MSAQKSGIKKFISSPGRVAILIAGVFFVVAMVQKSVGATDITSMAPLRRRCDLQFRF